MLTFFLLLFLIQNIFGCQTDADCSFNGICPSLHGKCVCDAAWKGNDCTELNILPGKKSAGYRYITTTNTSSWGGAVLYDPIGKKWHMWLSEMALHCGMHTWTTNSQTVHASSIDPLGLYKREGVAFPIWSHEVDVVRDPSSGKYVAFMSYNSPSPRKVCKTCTDGTTDPECKKLNDKIDSDNFQPMIENTDPTYMSWSQSPEGPWSKPVMVLMDKPQMDTNMAPVILNNGSLIGMWRDHHPGGKHSTPHLVTATNWSDPSTYSWNQNELFSDKTVSYGIEDMFLWQDLRGNFHVLFHDMDKKCANCGSHAYSPKGDGHKWTYTGVAYGPTAFYTDGTNFTFSHCERPHLVFDAKGIPIALTTGVKTDATGLSNNDQSFTLLRPLQT